jgi:hypothetical protein
MPRFDTRRYQPPVRIGSSQARTQQSQMLTDDERLARGAGNFGQKEVRNASVPIRLRIRRAAGVNSTAATASTIPIGFTRRKRGLPPIALPPPS